MKRYVQHKSGIGEKWVVYNDTTHTWTVRSAKSGLGAFNIPKSEYREVPAPEHWERCGSGVVSILHGGGTLWMREKALSQQMYLPDGYRWAWDKQEDGTLVIEKLVTE